MNLILSTILLYITCQGNICHVIDVTPEAAAVAACESGDTVTLGSVKWNAIGYNGTWSTDGGAWQFNSYWIWNPSNLWALNQVAPQFGMTGAELAELYPSAAVAPAHVQYTLFEIIWNDGYGWRNWSASQPCWSQWLTINERDQAVWRTDVLLPKIAH